MTQGIGPVGAREVENNPPAKELWTADFGHLIGIELQVISLHQSCAHSKGDTKKEQIIIIWYRILFFVCSTFFGFFGVFFASEGIKRKHSATHPNHAAAL